MEEVPAQEHRTELNPAIQPFAIQVLPREIITISPLLDVGYSIIKGYIFILYGEEISNL